MLENLSVLLCTFFVEKLCKYSYISLYITCYMLLMIHACSYMLIIYRFQKYNTKFIYIVGIQNRVKLAMNNY